MTAPAFDGATSLDDIVAYVNVVRRRPARRGDLVGLLAEQSPLYAGRGTGEAERLRGYVLASFESGLPPAGLPYVLEELETGRNPYTVAAAARALRGSVAPPNRAVALLLGAVERIRSADDGVCFDRFAPTAEPAPATALGELFRTFAWLGPRAAAARAALKSMRDDGGFSRAIRAEIEGALEAVSRSAPECCCDAPLATTPADPVAVPRVSSVADVELQDQAGASLTYGEFFAGRPSVVTFFYTRCMNPEKCSLTITKLARLQHKVSAAGLLGRVNIAALTYDPAYDLPERLRIYGADRGMIFDASNRLLRTAGPFDPVQHHFGLGVGYGSVTVNRHRLELFVLDESARVTADFTRALWHEDEVLGALKTRVGAVPSPV